MTTLSNVLNSERGDSYAGPRLSKQTTRRKGLHAWAQSHTTPDLAERLSADDIVLSNEVIEQHRLQKLRTGQLGQKEIFLSRLHRKGVGYLRSLNEREIVFGKQGVNGGVPSEREIRQALEQNHRIVYDGPYTGPGPATSRMYEQAGWDTRTLQTGVSNRVRLVRKSRAPGPRRSLSVDLSEVGNNPDERYRLGLNRTPGPTDHVLLIEA